MKKRISLLLAILISMVAFSQNIKLEGTVKDSIGNPLEMANVIAFKKGTNFLQSYSITDSKGHYKLSLAGNEAYTLKASFLGFETKNIEIEIDDSGNDIIKNIVLKELSESLNEVEITYEMPVKIVGDTIMYNADSFTTGTEKKLEDVLEKLPGIDIDDNGEIEVEGKKVEKLLVEGKEFFDGDTKLATQNIPASAIDKVQVLKNYNEVAGMRGVTNNEDNIAINIKLKQGKKRFWFGEVNSGIGVSEDDDFKYLAKPKLFYYSPDRSINILADFNNIGLAPFTRGDYFRFTGGLHGSMRGSGTSYNVSSSGMGFLTQQNNRALEIISNFGALNFSVLPNKKLDFNGFAIANKSETTMRTASNVVYNTTGAVDKSSTEAEQNSELAMLKFSTTYKPNDDVHLDVDVFGKMANQSEFSDVTSTQLSADTFKEEKPKTFNTNLNLYYTIDAKNIVSAEVQYMYEKDAPLFNSLADSIPFNLIPTVPEPIFNMIQNRDFDTSKFDGKLDYYFVLNPKSHLNISLGSTLSSQNFNSNIVQELENGDHINFNEPELNNDVTYNFTDLFLGAEYKMVTGIFTFNPGVTVHQYKIKDDQLGTVEGDNLTKILPNIYARLQFKSSESLRFNYSITSQFSDINKAAEGYVYANYKALTKGNRDLENSLNHRYSLSYFSFSMFSFTNINASISYTKKLNGIKNNTELDGVGRISYPVNSPFADETFTGYFRYGKTYSRLKTNFRANFNNSIFNNVVNDEHIKSKSFSHSYRASIATKFRNAPNFELGYQLSLTNYSATSSTTNRPFANMEIGFLKHFILTADYSYYNYKNEENDYSNTYSFLNADLYFEKEGSKWEFKLSGNNLTNNRSINSDRYNEVSDSNITSLYYIQPRVWMFSVKYNL